MANYLAARRNELGLTQKEIAEQVGVSEGTVSRWESGSIPITRSIQKRPRNVSFWVILFFKKHTLKHTFYFTPSITFIAVAEHR